MAMDLVDAQAAQAGFVSRQPTLPAGRLPRWIALRLSACWHVSWGPSNLVPYGVPNLQAGGSILFFPGWPLTALVRHRDGLGPQCGCRGTR